MVAVVSAEGLVCICKSESGGTHVERHLCACRRIATDHCGLASGAPAGDVEVLTSLIAEDVTFYSPAVQSPIQGREAALLVMVTVAEVLDNIRYHRTFVAGPLEAGLEFSALIGKLPVRGIDLIRLDRSGRILAFEVMMRPLRALSAVADAVGNRVAPRMLQLKLKPGTD